MDEHLKQLFREVLREFGLPPAALPLPAGPPVKTQEAATLLGVSPEHLKKLARGGALAGVAWRISEGKNEEWRFDQQRLQAWKDAGGLAGALTSEAETATLDAGTVINLRKQMRKAGR